VHLAAGGRHLLLVALEIEVEVGQRVVLDVAGLVAQASNSGSRARALARLSMKPRGTFCRAPLQLGVVERPRWRSP
jgi:hypothetical protein